MSKYIKIKFQNGPIQENEINGCQIEDVLDVLMDKIIGFQHGNLPCLENKFAILKLQEAKLWLNKRTFDRVKRNVEGKNIL